LRGSGRGPEVLILKIFIYEVEGYAMSTTTPSARRPFGGKLARFIELEIAALLISCLIAVAIFVTIVGTTIKVIEEKYPRVIIAKANRFRDAVGIGAQDPARRTVGLSAVVSLSASLVSAAFIHIHIFGKYFIMHYEAENDGDSASMDERIRAAGAGLRSLFSVNAAIFAAVSVIFAPFGGGALSMLTGALTNKYAGGLAAVTAVSLFALHCRAGEFSDAAHRRIRIFAVIMILNYSSSLLCAFLIELYVKSHKFFMTTLLMSVTLTPGMMIFASVIHLKSDKLRALKKIKALGQGGGGK
jgi:hypothetical protein